MFKAEAALLDGKHVSSILREQVKARIQSESLKPHLHVISVGEDPASKVFIKQKRSAAEATGIAFSQSTLPDDITLEELRNVIIARNADDNVHGMIVQLPLPAALQKHEREVLDLVAAEKDVDCFHPVNTGHLSIGQPVFLPATPAGILKLLDHYKIETKGKLCVILGKSNIVGKPLGLLLADEKGPAATVVLCDRYTENISELTRQADLIVVAAGRHHLLNDPAWLRDDKQAVIIDVGIHRVQTTEGKFVVQGDVDADAIREHCRFLTPVPGGVGPMTVACLLEQVVEASSRLAIRKQNIVSPIPQSQSTPTALLDPALATQRLSRAELEALMAKLSPSFPVHLLQFVFPTLCDDDDRLSLQAFVCWATGAQLTRH